MTDMLDTVLRLRRPALLVAAARCGQQDYRRDIHLARLLGRMLPLPGPAGALAELTEFEDLLEYQRRARDAAYSVTRHVEVLIALLGETVLLMEERQSTGTNRDTAETETAAVVPLPPRPDRAPIRFGARPYMKASGISALRRAT